MSFVEKFSLVGLRTWRTTRSGFSSSASSCGTGSSMATTLWQLVGPLVAGRLQGKAPRLAMNLRLPRPDGQMDVGSDALTRLSVENVLKFEIRRPLLLFLQGQSAESQADRGHQAPDQDSHLRIFNEARSLALSLISRKEDTGVR